MGSDDKPSDKVTPITPTGRQVVSTLARRSGAGLKAAQPTPGVMCQQGQDWSRGMACFPQKLVQLVGYRDPDARPSSPLRPRQASVPAKPVTTDTPIG